MQDRIVIHNNRKVVFEGASDSFSVCLYEDEKPIIRIKHNDCEYKSIKTTSLYYFLCNFLKAGVPDITIRNLFYSLGRKIVNHGEMIFIKEDFQICCSSTGSNVECILKFSSDNELGFRCKNTILTDYYNSFKKYPLKYWLSYIAGFSGGAYYIKEAPSIPVVCINDEVRIDYIRNRLDIEYIRETGEYIKICQEDKKKIIKYRLSGIKMLIIWLKGFTDENYAILDISIDN